MPTSKCKICRRQGAKLFLKGEKCLSPKCAMIKKPYAPGPRKKKRPRPLSEYGKQLREKQKLRNWYNLREKKFRQYVMDTLEARGKIADTSAYLIKLLENRLDNVVFRLGFAVSRSAAKKIISHKHILVNKKPINIASYQVKKGDVISLKEKAIVKPGFKNLSTMLKGYTAPTWLKLDAAKLEGQVSGEPNLEESAPPADLLSIFEFYSK
ncbi:MAG: 30S ribosomal protein S4 [Candidatus Nealsonbacteria bacterium]